MFHSDQWLSVHSLGIPTATLALPDETEHE
jgi:hypothetical protein